MGKVISAVVGGLMGGSLATAIIIDKHEEWGLIVGFLAGIPLTFMFIILGIVFAILVDELANG